MEAEIQDERRQYVRYAFFRVDPTWRGLPHEDRDRGKKQLVEVFEEFEERMSVLRAYSLMGTRGDADFMFWQVSYRLEDHQDFATRIFSTGMAPYLTTPYSYFSMTKRSIYVKDHAHEGQEGTRLTVIPGQARYLFVYPFVKTAQWYRLPERDRQRMMSEHIRIGHQYPSVKINTTYSYGLDDQEHVVAFESDSPSDFLDLVLDLREAESRPYTERDVPIFTCVRMPVAEMLETLGGVGAEAGATV